MKPILLILSILGLPILSIAQTDWLWAEKGPNNSLPYGYHSHITFGGEIIIAGTFKDSILDGNGQIIHSYGMQDAFISKYTNTGQLLWTRTGGGLYNDEANGIAEDSKGNLYITGKFTDTAHFGSIDLNYRDSVHWDYSFRGDIFLAKYDHLGNLLWVKRSGGIWKEYPTSLTIDNKDNIYFTGAYGESGVPGPVTFDTVTLIAPNGGSFFVAKYDTSGGAIWVKKMGGSAWAVTTDSLQSIYMAGVYSGYMAATFDTVVLPAVGPLAYGGSFIVKYDSGGHALWARGAGGNRPTEALSILADKIGGAYISGSIMSDITAFGNGYNLPSGYSFDNVFIARYSSTGNLTWAKTGGINPYDMNYTSGGLVMDKHSNIYLTGFFSNTSYFGGDTTQSYGARDIMVCKYDSSGNPIWFTHAGGNNDNYGNDLSIDTAGNLYITGVVGSGLAIFGNNQVNNTSGQYNMFIAKLGQSPLSLPHFPFIAPGVIAYPNPSLGSFTISWGSIPSFEKAIIRNALGQVVMTVPVQKGAHELKVFQPSLADGLYFIELQGTGGTASSAITIRH